MGTTTYGGKGSKGRAANGDRLVGAASCRRDHHTMASCQNPPSPWCGMSQACREHANDTAAHVELPQKKIWYSESASTRHDSVPLHRRGYGMWLTIEHVPMVLRRVSRLGPGTTVDAPVQP